MVRVRHLSKRYRIGTQQSRYRNLLALHSVTSVEGDSAWGSIGDRRSRADDAIIWALRNVSFDVGRGEVLGIIGPNGAGKSTLLKVLSRITEPTEGEAQIHGRVASLLEVGTGFHPELTGRENIFLNGVLLGMKRAEVTRRFDAIVEFSGVEKFIDTPVKRYSSGMYVRLAFAVAAHLEPEILIVDEVLAVGDAAFQRKCLGKMGEVAGSGRTVLLVSHNMGSIKALAATALWLDEGRVIRIGDPRTVVNEYLAAGQPDSLRGVYDDRYVAAHRVRHEKYVGQVEVTSVTLLDVQGQPADVFLEGSDLRVALTFSVHDDVKALEAIIRVKTVDGQLLFTCLPGKHETIFHPGRYRALVRFNLTPLLPGTYQGDIVLLSHLPQDQISPAFRFEVAPDPTQAGDERTIVVPSASLGHTTQYDGLGVIRVRAAWEEMSGG